MKRLLLVTLLILTVGLLPVWLWQPWEPLQLDSFTQNLPFIYETHRILQSGELPLWSWNTAAGESFIGSYAYYTLTSPFVWVQSLLPVDWVLPSMWVVLYLKVLCLVASARLYLRSMSLSDTAANAGALLYAFSAFNITNFFYWHFSNSAIVFPLFLLAIENYIARPGRRQIAWIAVGVFGVIFINFYLAVGSLISGSIYILFRLWGTEGFGRKLLQISLGGILGIALASPLWLTVVCYLTGSSRAGMEFSSAEVSTAYYIFKRFLSFFYPKFIEGGFLNFNSLGYSSSTMYLPFTGILAAFLFVRRNLRGRLSLLLILLAVLYVVYPLSGIFVLFTNELYFRWGYFFVLMAILATMRCLSRDGAVSIKDVRNYIYIITAFTLLAFLLMYMRKTFTYSFTDKLRGETVAIIIVLSINLFGLWLWAKRGAKTCRLIPWISAIAILNIALTGIFTFHSQYLHKFDNPPSELVKTHGMMPLTPADTLADFTGCRTLSFTDMRNDNLILGIPGFVTYTSCGSPGMYGFYSRLNLCPAPYPSMQPYMGVAATPRLLSVNEVLRVPEFSFLPEELRPDMRLKKRGKEYDTYELKSLPMGFTYDSYLPESRIAPLLHGDRLETASLLLSRLVVRDEDIPLVEGNLPCDTTSAEGLLARFSGTGLYGAAENLDSVMQRRSIATADEFRGTSTGWVARTSLVTKRILFFSVPADKGFSYFIDGQPVQPIRAQLGMTALIVPAGTHTIEARFFPAGLKAGLIIAAPAFCLLLLMLIWSGKRSVRIGNTADK